LFFGGGVFDKTFIEDMISVTNDGMSVNDHDAHAAAIDFFLDGNQAT